MIIKSIKWLFALLLLCVASFSIASLIMSIPSDTIESQENIYNISNLHLIDKDTNSGYTLYRIAEPTEEDFQNLCRLGVTEIAVLSGTGEEIEQQYQKACPELKIVYNHKQSITTPLDKGFIKSFDYWITAAKAEGKTIAFRCNGGSHRTGRLAGYYQMKYRDLSVKEAWDLAQSRGVAMSIVDNYGGIQEQLIGLQEFINNKPCSQNEEYCVSSKPLNSTIVF